MSRIANFCAVCGSKLIQQPFGGRIRPFCEACQQPTYFDPKVAVIIFALRGDEVLLIQRAIDPGAGKWALPAGFVDYDEAPEDAAIRETLEETGLHVAIRKLLAVFPKRDSGLADISIAYSVEIIGGEATGRRRCGSGRFFRRGPTAATGLLSINLAGCAVARWRIGAANLNQSRLGRKPNRFMMRLATASR